jgi:hypothetical protein
MQGSGFPILEKKNSYSKMIRNVYSFDTVSAIRTQLINSHYMFSGCWNINMELIN